MQVPYDPTLMEAVPWEDEARPGKAKRVEMALPGGTSRRHRLSIPPVGQMESESTSQHGPRQGSG